MIARAAAIAPGNLCLPIPVQSVVKNLALRAAVAVPIAVCHLVAIVSLGARHRRERGHLLAVRPDAAAPAAGAGAGQLVNLSAPGPKPGSQSCNNAGRLRRRLQLPDVPRPRAGADGLHRHRGAPVVRRQPRLPGPDAERRGHVRVGQLLPGARPAAGARPADRPRRRQGPRRVAAWSCSATPTGGRRFGASPAVLERHDHRQRPVDDDRRRGAARLRRARRSGRSRRCSCRSRCARSCWQRGHRASTTGAATGSTCSRG